MTITDTVIKNIIRKLVLGQDYRIEVITLLDANFLEYIIDFFKRIVDAKLKGGNITTDWYKKEMLNSDQAKKEIAINSGLNMKTITNMYNSATKTIVVDASLEHYDALYNAINSLVETDSDINITLSIKFKAVSVDLNINESLIVINTLAVKRSEIRGGLWSTAGKQTEKNLVKTLCKIFSVPEQYYIEVSGPESLREVDYYLLNSEGKRFRCEIKLMGRGNPESADVVIARDSQIFIADKLSDTNKIQLNYLKVQWLELRSTNGYKKFLKLLKKNKIPCKDFECSIEEKIDAVLDEILD